MKVKVPTPSFTWNQSSMDLLTQAEKRLLSCLNNSYSLDYISLRRECQIWTLRMNEAKKPATPLVLLHGMGGGIGLWVLNLDSLSAHRPLYAMDLPGFGKSSRPQFSINPQFAKLQFINWIEEWRKRVGISHFHLLGHSFGGYLASLYTLKYPEKVKHLILAEPWGILQKPAGYDNIPRPLWVRAVTTVIRQFDPFAGLRAAGPWGADLIKRIRPDIGRRFSSSTCTSEVVYDYIFQCNIREPASGESVFRTLSDAGWARYPLINQIDSMPGHIPVTLLYGARSWLDNKAGQMVAEKLEPSQVKCHILPNAGHHVYADQATQFNEIVNEILLESDTKSEK